MKGYKLHMISINYRAYFVWYPEGEKPRITNEMIERLSGAHRGQCIRIG